MSEATPPSDPHSRSSAAGSSAPRTTTKAGRRIERHFARVGLFACVLAAPVVLLVADVLLLGPRAADTSFNPFDTSALEFLTHDGRPIGTPRPGMLRIRLAPAVLYEFVPDQPAFDIDAAGLRGPQPAPRKTGQRVLILGGSAAFGHQVAHEKTFVALLAARFPDVEFLNAGVPGYESGQEFAAYATKWSALEPDLVISFTGWNDLVDEYEHAAYHRVDLHLHGTNNVFGALEERLVRMQRIEQDPSAALLQTCRTLAGRSRFLGLLGVGRERIFEAPPVTEFDPDAPEHRVWRDAARDVFVRNIVALRDLVEARGAKYVCVVQPDLGAVLPPGSKADVSPGDAYAKFGAPAYHRFVRESQDRLAAADVRTVDLVPLLRKTDSPWSLFLDPVHLAESGHALVARELAPIVGERLRTAP